MWLHRSGNEPQSVISLISLRTPALGFLFLKHGLLQLTFGKKAHYSGDVSKNATFWLSTQDSGNQAFSKRASDVRTPESVLLQKALWKLCVLSLQQRHTSQLLTLFDCDSKAEAMGTQASELSRSPGEAGGLRFHLSAVCSSFRGARAPPPGRLQNHWHCLWPTSICWSKE